MLLYVSGDGTVVDVQWRTSAHKGLVLKTWCTEPSWSPGSNSTDKHRQHETKCHCKQRHNPSSLQDASPLRTGIRKASSQVSSFPMASLFVLYFPEEKDMKTFERNVQRFETVCFSIFNTFRITKKSYHKFQSIFFIRWEVISIWKKEKREILPNGKSD